MPFRTRPHWEDRQIVQYSGESITLSGVTKYSNQAQIVVEPTILYDNPLTGFTFVGGTADTITYVTGQTQYDLAGLIGYQYPNNYRPGGSGLVIKPPIKATGFDIYMTGTTGTTTVDVTGFVLTAIDSGGTAMWASVNSLSADTNTYITSASIDCNTNVLTLTRNDAVNVTTDLSCLTFTGNTSGDCISDLYVTNIHGCSPITVHDEVQSNGSTASGILSFAFGNGVTASGDNSFVAGGRANVASGLYSYAEGFNTSATGGTSHSEGDGTLASGYASHAEGENTSSRGTGSHSEGQSTVASGNGSHAEGSSTVASENYTHAEGNNTTASAIAAHAEGNGTTASNAAAHAEGFGGTASGAGSHAEGFETLASGDYSHAEGSATSATTFYAHAAGRLTIVNATGGYASGNNNEITTISDYSAIIGGTNNIIDSNFGVGGTAYDSFIGAGLNNEIREVNYSFIGAGENNFLTSPHSAIVGGKDNTITGLSDYSAMLGGSGNTVSNLAQGSAIVGGFNNEINGSSDQATYSFIGGGTRNTQLKGDNSTILGGSDNTNGGDYSSILGGLRNSSTGDWTSIISSIDNTIFSQNSTMLGGSGNTINFGHDYTNIIGGKGISSTEGDMTYTDNLTVTGDYLIHSDSERLSTLSTISSLFKGGVTSFNTDKAVGSLEDNPSPSGNTGSFFGNFNGFPTTKSYGSLTYHGTGYTRATPTTTGTAFYRNKVVLKGFGDTDGMVINPKADTDTAKLWFEINGKSMGILTADPFGGSGDGYWGFGMSKDGTELPTATVQIGGTGTTGSFKYLDGNQSNGYVLTTNGNGEATWQAPSGGGTSIDPYFDTAGTSVTWDVSGTSTNYQITLTGNTTLTMSNVRNGDYGTLIVTQDGVGSRTLTFGAGTHRVVNGGGGTPTLTATPSAIDILSFTYNGSVFYWTVGNDYT